MSESERFGALTMDTQTIQKGAFRFNQSPLNLLCQFRGGPIRVVFASIVVKETTVHLERDIRTLCATLKRDIRDSGRLLPQLAPFFDKNEVEKIDPGEAARKLLSGFLSEVGAEEAGVKWADLWDIERRYFGTLPPFAHSDNKKHEFPDAIALSSIEGWAKRNGRRVLAVSEDKGWIGYDSELITVVPTLTDALGILQNDPEHRAHLFVAQRIKELPLEESYPFATTFSGLLSEAIQRIDFDIDADSEMRWEADYEQVELLGYSVEDDFTIVKREEGEIVAEITLMLQIRVFVTITFLVYDSVDGDEVPMGDAEIIRNIALDERQAFVTFSGDFNTDDWDVTKVELSSLDDTIELGYVDPDWRHEEQEEP